MDYVIYSIGSGAYLAEVLKAVASITGSGDFSQLIQIGMVLGIIILGFQTIMNGGKEISVGQIAAAFLLYALMFGPTVDVAVHGVYDNHDETVGDVPLGIAAPGAMVSQVGLGLTEMFETAFAPLNASTAPTGLSQGGGFVDALKVLNTVRRGGSDTALLAALDEAEPGFRESWDQYLRNCTSQKILRGEATIEEIYDDPFDETEGIKFNSKTFSTPYYETGGLSSPVNKTCTAAYPKLISWTDSVSSGHDLDDVLERLIKPEGGMSAGPSGNTPSEEISDSLDMLGLGTEDAQDFVKLSLLEPIFIQSMGDRYKDFLDTNTAVMVNQALDQRNVQWASEQTIFMSTVRPMMTFIEGFAYSILPFAAFILVLGGIGMKLAMKYGQMLLWVQLWMPVLAMTNLYLHTVAAGELAQIDNFSSSFYALDQADKRLSHWIAVGGMLAASTPILTLVLLTGSAYAMTSLAQRMQGADHVNEKVASPDAVQPGAVMQSAAMYQHSAGSGRVLSGAEDSLFKFDVGQLSQSSMQSARQEQVQASESLMGSATTGYKEGETLSSSQGRVESFNSALNSTSTEGVNALNDTASQIGEKLDLSKTQTEALRSEMAANASAGTGKTLGGILSKMGISVSAAASQGFSVDQTVSDTLQSTAGSSWSESDTAALAESLSHQLQGTSQEQLAQTWGAERAHSMQSSASEVTSTSKSFQKLEQASEQFGASESFRADRVGKMLTDSGASAKLDGYFNTNASSDMKQSANERAIRYAADKDDGGYGMSSTDAKAAAQMYELYHGDSEHQAEFLSVLGDASGGSYGDTMPGSGAGRNEGIGDGIDQPADVGGGAYQSTPTPEHSLGPNGDRGLVESHYGANADAARQTNSDNQQKQAGDAISSRIDGAGSPSNTWAGNKLASAVLGESATADVQGGFAGASDRIMPGGGWSGNDPTSSSGDMMAPTMLQNPTGGGAVSSVGQGLGLPDHQAQAFGYGSMNEDQRQAFEAGGGSVDLSSPAAQAAFNAGQTYRDTGDINEARGAYNQGRVENARDYYASQFDSAGVGTIASALHSSDADQRQALFQSGIDAVAREAATAEGVNYDQLSPQDQSRYDNWATNVADSVATGLTSEQREGGARAAYEHSEIMRLHNG
ncbi:conjugal transfer protein TraG N-terminal domain-containing protein [Vreelandella massiliensis]|uniref:conjugal transfer protein TraG N-terminal domain-containing protein n=1 Tax=Vreelandella massiliensis TaxID=1816686 RepID=UPI00096A9E76|nr:conjugal transfer protein TraG N-terminal domain-containing protein [Halomonas massiliensis]